MFIIRYPNAIVKGQELSEANTSQQPTIHFKGQTGKLYTLIMSDPDAPQADWLHWLVINNNGTQKQEIVSYTPPTPPSGTHRYIFYLCIQPTTLKIRAPAQRGNFNTQKFIADNKLIIVAQKQFLVSTHHRSSLPNV